MDKEFFNGMNLAEDISDEVFQAIVEGWEKVQDLISKEEFIQKFNEIKEEQSKGDIGFFDDKTYLDLVINPLLPEDADDEQETLGDVIQGNYVKIADVEPGHEGFNVIARVMSYSSPKYFTSRKGKQGKLCNMQIADNTGELRLVLWTENIKHLKHVKEGDIVEIINVECKEGYRGGKEFSLRPRSQLRAIDSSSPNYPTDIDSFPAYSETVTDIADLKADETVNVIGRLIRVPSPHSYESNGKRGKVVSLEIQDATGKTKYTLWNNDVKIVETLELHEGDVVKILNEEVRERNGEISLSHWNGRILKTEGEFDIPEFEEKFVSIANANEMEDVSLIGLVTKVMDTIEFDKQNGSKGYVKSVEISDHDGSIRVTLWGDDTKLNISKGDILKISGANIEHDDYSPSGYRVNTNWNTIIKINPEDDNPLFDSLREAASLLGPIPIEQISDMDEQEGEEVDILARLISLSDIRTFERDDGSQGYVRSAIFADASSHIRVSLWDEKAQAKFVIGRAYQIENARIRVNMYAVELNLGKMTRVIEVAETKVDLPPASELEESIYDLRKIEEVDEDDREIKILARIIDIQSPREFERQDGTKGIVGNMDIADETGYIRASLWDDKTQVPLSFGDAIKIQNPSVRYNGTTDQIELNIGVNTNILTPSAEEISKIPSIEELEKTLYESKLIEEIAEDDNNIIVEGQLIDVYGERPLMMKCHQCRNNLSQEDLDAGECSYCGNTTEEPDYLLMIPCRLRDESGEIQITFFNELASKLLGMTQDEIIKMYEEEEDFGFLEGKIENLEGLNVKVLADVDFNEFNEENRLNPRKIMESYY
ncbi:OB-fold nucleic acid binding domain-containing protein [uncultured Methanobrevibacter sp.]|uniref:OB-fold nucleic acid binding domain-containing protein n=1 Tax=uncultured Methanobrevibacter sp. TaxID=253161 RepID=UPI0026395808